MSVQGYAVEIPTGIYSGHDQNSQRSGYLQTGQTTGIEADTSSMRDSGGRLVCHHTNIGDLIAAQLDPSNERP